MDFELNEQQAALRTMVRDFAEKEVAPVAQELDDKEEFPYGIVKKMGELGLMGLYMPEEYGGGGADTLSFAIATEELARVDSSVAVAPMVSQMAGSVLANSGSEAQKRRWLPPLCRGEIVGAFGLTEPGAGSDAGATQTAAVLQGGQWLINGTKCFITNSGTDITGFVIVTAVTGKRGGRSEVSNILVPQGTPGYTQAKGYKKLGWHASDTHELSFADCRVPEENLVGERGRGFHQFLRALDTGRITVASLGVGLAQGCLELSLRYAQDRVQFGKPIAQFQAIQFKLADMAVKVELARLITYKAATLKDQGKPFARESAMAKVYASEAAVRVSEEAVQIHGGFGFMDDCPASRFYRDAKILTIGEGTSEVQRLVIARQLLG